MSPIDEAFRRARIAVAAHTDAMADADATWREETATELVLANTHPVVRFADFTRGEESTVGADWLWCVCDSLIGAHCDGSQWASFELTYSVDAAASVRTRKGTGKSARTCMVRPRPPSTA